MSGGEKIHEWITGQDKRKKIGMNDEYY